MSKGSPTNGWRHGTPTGYSQHQTLGEQPCPACTAAKSEYDKRRRSAPDQVIKNRMHARAQHAAQRRLVQAHPAIYAALYAEEKDRLAREAGGDE